MIDYKLNISGWI